jgi:hypothetical protein
MIPTHWQSLHRRSAAHEGGDQHHQQPGNPSEDARSSNRWLSLRFDGVAFGALG